MKYVLFGLACFALGIMTTVVMAFEYHNYVSNQMLKEYQEHILFLEKQLQKFNQRT